MSYSVRNVRNLYYADTKKDALYTTDATTNKVTFADEGSWNAYKDREGCMYFECVENRHIVRTPKIERVTYTKVTKGSDMNSKIFNYEVTINTSKIKKGKTYTLNIIVPNFNGIDIGLEQSVRGSYTATKDGDTDVAKGIVDDIKNRVMQGTGDSNYDSSFLWMQYIDLSEISFTSNVIKVSTKIPDLNTWEAGEYMPELQERELKFEFAPVYDVDDIPEYSWGSVSKSTTTPANDYKKKLDNLEWFYNAERGELERVRVLRDPLPKANLHNFYKSNYDYSVLDLHYRVDGDGSIMGDVDITIIVKEDNANSTTNAEAILTALKIGTATVNKSIETYGA